RVFMSYGKKKINFVFSEGNILEAKMIINGFDLIVEAIKKNNFICTSIPYNISDKINIFIFNHLTLAYDPKIKVLEINYGDSDWSIEFEIKINEAEFLELDKFLSKMKNKFNKFDNILNKYPVYKGLIGKLNDELKYYGYTYNSTL